MSSGSLPQRLVAAGIREEDSLIPALACEEHSAAIRTAIAYHLWIQQRALDPTQLRQVMAEVLPGYLAGLTKEGEQLDPILGMDVEQYCAFLRFLLKCVCPAIAEHGSVDDVRLMIRLLDPRLRSTIWLLPLDLVLIRREELEVSDLEGVGVRIARCLRAKAKHEGHASHVRCILKRLGTNAQRAYRHQLETLSGADE